jgi:hypothetical protein
MRNCSVTQSNSTLRNGPWEREDNKGTPKMTKQSHFALSRTRIHLYDEVLVCGAISGRVGQAACPPDKLPGRSAPVAIADQNEFSGALRATGADGACLTCNQLRYTRIHLNDEVLVSERYQGGPTELVIPSKAAGCACGVRAGNDRIEVFVDAGLSSLPARRL